MHLLPCHFLSVFNPLSLQSWDAAEEISLNVCWTATAHLTCLVNVAPAAALATCAVVYCALTSGSADDERHGSRFFFFVQMLFFLSDASCFTSLLLLCFPITEHVM